MGEKVRIIDPREDWSSEYSIGFLPRGIRDFFRAHADQLYDELRKNRLEVALVPAPEPRHLNHMIRVAISQNPHWYQQLYKTTPGRLRRPHSLRALDRIRHLRDPQLSQEPIGAVQRNWAYVTLYREVIFERLVFGYEEQSVYIPPEPRVQAFFEVEGIDEVLEHPF